MAFFAPGREPPVLASRPAPRLITPADHALALHPAGLGRVSIARRLQGGGWRETSLPVGDLAYAVRHLAGEPDVYLTQNRFLGRRRLVSRLAELDALFVDLDYYKTTHADAHPRHVLDLALDALQAERIPPPSFAVATGRGLALVWLHQPVPRAALPRWRACQGALWHALRHLGADRLAGDAARVLRLVGTRHGGAGTPVEAITPVGEPWDFDPLADEILPLPRAELVALRLERAKRRAAGQGAPSPARWFTGAGLWELRLAELQQLLQHRWLGTLPGGQRDLWMLLAGTAMSYLVPAPMVRREIVALADQVTSGCWRERETLARMGAVVARAERAARGEKVEHGGRLVDPRYRFRTATVVEALGITEAEMRACCFRHLVSPEIRREHHRLDKTRRRRELGMVPRPEYEAKSASRLEPWRTEGVSRATWYRRRETSLSRCMVAKPSDPPPPRL
jgi:hypothetical protein